MPQNPILIITAPVFVLVPYTPAKARFCIWCFGGGSGLLTNHIPFYSPCIQSAMSPRTCCSLITRHANAKSGFGF